MKNVSSYNDLTAKDQVNMNWNEIKRKAHERHIKKVVKHLVKLSFKDISSWISVILFIASFFYTLWTIWHR